MTQYFNDLMEQLRSEDPSNTSDHYLFLLGTSVNYVDHPIDTPDDHFYVRGETFSYAAQLTSHLLGETKHVIKHESASVVGEPQYAHSYHSPSVDVINGPDAAGFEVGDRLAKALMLALTAVAEGKARLHISGFSRGGVESIVLTHELARVMEMLRADLLKAPKDRRTLAKIIAESSSVPGMAFRNNPSYTRATLEKLLAVNDLNVPNNTDMDEEASLKNKLLFNLDKMKVDLFVLDPVPGGNYGKVLRLGWQEPEYFYNLPEFVENKQEFVQKHETSNCFKPVIPLGMPYEVLPGCHGTSDGNQYDDNSGPIPSDLGEVRSAQNMVLRRWIDFTFPNVTPKERIDLHHDELDEMVFNYMIANKKERNVQLLENYMDMIENYPAFEYLATINYTGLGRYMAKRQVHFHQRGNTSISDLDPHGGEKFLNLQHVQLWMSNQLHAFNFFDKTLIEQTEWLTDNIQNAFNPPDLSDSNANPQLMIANLLQNKNNHPLVQESLSFLINTVMQTYLRNHLSDEERLGFKAFMESASEILNDPRISERSVEMAEFAKNLSVNISSDMTHTMLQHQNALLSSVQKQLKEHAEGLEYIEELEDLEDKLERESIIATHRLNWLINTQKLCGDLDLLSQQINALKSWCDKEMLTQTWGNSLPNFEMSIEENIDFKTQKERLFRYIGQQQTLLQDSAIQLLRNMPEALNNKPEELEEGFYGRIHRFANIDRLEASHLQLQQTLVQKDENNESILQHLRERTRKLELIEHRFQSLLKDTAQQQGNIDSLTKELETATGLIDEAKKREALLYSREQRDATVKVQCLLKHCYEYQNHLNRSRDTSELLEEKKEIVGDLIDILENPERSETEEYNLPTEQLEQFNTALNDVQEDLKAHRDPSWQRFFRDSLRIVTIALSGIGFYRMATGRSPHFFKSSHGERFVEEVAQHSGTITTVNPS